MEEKLKDALIKEYGFNDGFRIFTIVIPNIQKDFYNILNSSLIGLPVSEEYCFDDLNGSITITGVKTSATEVKIQSYKVNNRIIV